MCPPVWAGFVARTAKRYKGYKRTTSNNFPAHGIVPRAAEMGKPFPLRQSIPLKLLGCIFPLPSNTRKPSHGCTFYYAIVRAHTHTRVFICFFLTPPPIPPIVLICGRVDKIIQKFYKLIKHVSTLVCVIILQQNAFTKKQKNIDAIKCESLAFLLLILTTHTGHQQ